MPPLRRDGRGANLIEYILLVAVVGLSGLAAYALFGDRVRASSEEQAARVAILDGANGSNDRSLLIDADDQTTQPRRPTTAAPEAPATFPARDPMDPERINDLRAVLQRMPSGREALATFDGAGIPIRLTVGEGAYFNPDRRTVTLDVNMSQEILTLVLVHEANHARATVERRSPQPWSGDSRDDFIRLSLDEEIEGIRLESQAWKEAHDIGVDLPLPLHVNTYDLAYTRARLKAMTARPRLSADEIERRARQAAHDHMDAAMRNGQIVTTTDHQSPAETYGEQWDRYRPKTRR